MMLNVWIIRGLFLLLSNVICGSLCAKLIPVTHVAALERSTAALPCDVIAPDSRDEVLLVLWYREDLGTPIYSVDARERPFREAERWADDRALGSRAFFRLTTTPASLAIESVQESDAGLYRCRVDFKVAQTRNSRVNLTVIVPPGTPTIVEGGREVRLLVGPFNEGDSVSLICVVHGGRPLPTVQWFRDGAPIPSSGSTLRLGVTRNELTLHHLGRADLRAQLSCHASNGPLSRAQMATVEVDMQLRPLQVLIEGRGEALTAGRRYELLCLVGGSRPPAIITWWKEGKILKAEKETVSTDGNVTSSTLLFWPTIEDEGKNLTCKAANLAIAGSELYDSWTLSIHYSPESRVELGPSLQADAIREGSDVYFDCRVKAQPPAFRVEWRHQGSPLGHNISAGVILTNRSLVLQKVSRAASGNYSCVAHNAEGEGESPPFYLDVRYAPSCRPGQTRVHGVAKGETASIGCWLEANPSLVTFRWSFNNSAESVDVTPSRYTFQSDRSTVQYTPMTEMDYGTLLCWGNNAVGAQAVPCVFHIIAAGRPDPVHNCSVRNQSTARLVIACSEGFNGGLPQSFGLELFRSPALSLAANVTAPVPRFQLAGLDPGTAFLAHAFAFNAKGRSEPTPINLRTPPLPQRQLTSAADPAGHRPRSRNAAVFAFTPLVSVAIGVASALLVVALVVLFVLRFQCHDDKPPLPNQHGAHGAKQPLKGADGSDSASGCQGDERSPDVVPPHPSADPEETAFLRSNSGGSKRGHISTIESSLPPLPLLTLQRHQRPMWQHAQGTEFASSTLPRSFPLAWGALPPYSVGGGAGPLALALPPPCIGQDVGDDGEATPLMQGSGSSNATKRESTV